MPSYPKERALQDTIEARKHARRILDAFAFFREMKRAKDVFATIQFNAANPGTVFEISDDEAQRVGFTDVSQLEAAISDACSVVDDTIANDKDGVWMRLAGPRGTCCEG